LVLASSVIIGLVNRNTTITSMSVVRPRVNAKFCTSVTANLYSTAAARKDTESETRIVRRARRQPCSTADRSDLPSRTSSRSRSKNTTNESAVIPIATIKPAMPASDRAKLSYRLSSTTDRYVSSAEIARLEMATMPRPR
jgi:hypothetical protein